MYHLIKNTEATHLCAKAVPVTIGTSRGGHGRVGRGGWSAPRPLAGSPAGGVELFPGCVHFPAALTLRQGLVVSGAGWGQCCNQGGEGHLGV